MIDWSALFRFETPLPELFVRGTVVYLALFALLRFALRRQSGFTGVTDLLVVVLIADAVQNALGAGASVLDGLVLVAVIIGWSYALDWLGYRFPIIERFIHPPPLPLVKNGKIIRRNMRHELVTVTELHTAMREQGVEHVSQIKLACMESDGRVSFVTHSGEPPAKGVDDEQKSPE